MATTKKEILERKNALLRDLRLAHQHGVALPGEMALSQRELSAKYGLSIRTVSLEMQKLVEEGVLYTVPRVGTFVGQPRSERHNLFLALFVDVDTPNIQWSAIRAGFEDRIAGLGGTSLVLDFETARRYRQTGEIVSPAGVFEFIDLVDEPIWLEDGVAHAEFGQLPSVHAGSDAVYFDNLDGGWKATRHLLALGHKKIAFLGLHSEYGDPGVLLWSKQRETGWQQALEEAGLSAEGLAFTPTQMTNLTFETFNVASLEVANQFLKRDDVTAVVAVNAFAVRGLLRALRAANRPTKLWPAVVGFDTEIADSRSDAMHVVTALRLPWEEIGREAANLLWERTHGRLDGFEQRLVPMTLIPRLSCRQEWDRTPGMIPAPQNRIPAVA